MENLELCLLLQILTVVITQDLKMTKIWTERKSERSWYDLKKKKKFPCRLLSFRFCPIPKIENSEISEICLLLQILTAVLIQHFVQLVVDTIALAFIAFYLFMIIKQRFCNCNSKNFTWFLFFLIYILGLLVCNCNLALIRLYFSCIELFLTKSK